MKLFSWVHNKLNGGQENKKSHTFPATRHQKRDSREEFNDWPDELLAIGTFGNNDLKKKSKKQTTQGNQSTSEERVDFTTEEVSKLEKELTNLLSRRKADSEKEIANLPLHRFFNCPSSLEVDRRISNALSSQLDDNDEGIEKTIGLIIGICKDICADNKKKAIGKKSISFLLNMFVCRSGFPPPAPSLRDTFQESRMQKILRTLLHKKIKPQNPSRVPSMKRYIEDGKITKKRNKEETEEKTDDGCKWVKSDSEYIVLEI